jgi:aspartyl-tRNA synthetase
MMNAPSEVTLKQLRELHIEIKLPKKPEAATAAPAENA